MASNRGLEGAGGHHHHHSHHLNVYMFARLIGRKRRKKPSKSKSMKLLERELRAGLERDRKWLDKQSK